jgi:V8-like Glu-specific endopeptidase
MKKEKFKILLIALGLMLTAGCLTEGDTVELRQGMVPIEEHQDALDALERENIAAYGAADLTPAEKAAREPDLPAEDFDFLGYIDEIPFEDLPPPVQAFLRNNEEFQKDSPRTPDEHEESARSEAGAPENQGELGDLAVTLFSDGRIFRERPDRRPRHRDPDNLYSTDDEHGSGSADSGEPHEAGSQDDDDGFRKVYPPDGRTLITSASNPWSRVGIRMESDCPGCTATTNPAPLCSGTAVGPRHILTAAHCVKYEDFGTQWLTASPAGRGTGFSGSLYPFGRRFVIARTWPSGWSGKKTASAYYDYAILTLDNINWSPGWVAFGTQTVANLDFRNINSSGYPGRTRICTASPLGTGICGGYMYRQFATTKSVTAGTVYHRHDTQNGNSGMPLYDLLSSGSRVVRAVHHGVYAGHNAAHRIRSGSYGLICSTIKSNPSSYFTYGGC